MKVTKTNKSETVAILAIHASQSEIDLAKSKVLDKLSKDVNITGFRSGKAPIALVEKQINQSTLQTEFLDEIVNTIYVAAIQELKLRPIDQPQVTIEKFVPFTTIEIKAEVQVVGEVKLSQYKSLKMTKKTVSVTSKDIEEVIERLLLRDAAKIEVKHAAEKTDEVILDFFGSDAKNKEPIAGADGKDYPLVLGSNSFIPGFEDQLIGLKAGEEKSFDIVFPKDYSAKSLQNKKVTFEVKIHKVNKIEPPKLDSTFAAKIGPFKSVDELKEDIKKQLTLEKTHQQDQDYENELVTKIAQSSTVSIPKVLVDEQIIQMENEERQNLTYRGQTWEEHLKDEGKTEEEHRESNRDNAELRVKVGLILSEISEREGIKVGQDEIDTRIEILRNQYQDPKMRDELLKPENIRDIANRILAEKTIDRLVKYVSTK